MLAVVIHDDPSSLAMVLLHSREDVLSQHLHKAHRCHCPSKENNPAGTIPRNRRQTIYLWMVAWLL